MEFERVSSNKFSSEYNSILEYIDDGLITWDNNGKIISINKQAEGLIQVEKNEIINKNYQDIIKFPPNISHHIAEKITVHRVQTTVEVGNRFIELLITIHTLSHDAVLMFIHPMEKIRQLAQRQIGNSANFTFDNIVSQSKSIKRIITIAKRSVKTGLPIFINGEEGVGKLDFTMAIHNESPFKSGPFIIVNCKNYDPEVLIENILGSDESHGSTSKLELAHTGTLYLENIEFISQELQIALLNYLKTGLISRRNSKRLIPVKLNLITSTTIDLYSYVEKGIFGRQLYYELTSNDIEILPLRERREDIQYLVDNHINEYNRKHNTSIHIDYHAMESLKGFTWYGNSSELKNKVEKLLLNRKEDIITMKDIPQELSDNIEDNANFSKKIQSLEEIEKDAIKHAWEVFDGKINEISNALNVSRTTLWRKIKKYNIGN
ncbi:sigma 54-interacting transcriptional regulator [Vibrio sp. SS-MA-C1-2]|uniref:sigma 54-interacting transcriptional regulator n=1 Tax=Vibrio sp. SS-MA-C1-2 TaxID=2908646 RepID=UPI001F439839|nr:sigma 54-interacting transcriptional regulator [Vibrio sp. SS-MA-C1-2]UJF18434.1 sigma 54-interacting transcriptional regulator [Vibrio sp. SS-MA-C1-2]